MAHVVHPKTGVRHRLIFELRYERGELYWDRCGRIARTLAAEKGWAAQSVDAGAFRIRNDDQNIVFSYSPEKLDLTQSQSQEVSELLPPGEFAAIAEMCADVVVSALDVSSFPRIGFRLVTLFATETIEEAASRISRMAFFSPCKALSDLGELSHPSCGVVIARPKQMVRVVAAPFEQQVHLAPSLIAAARVESHKLWKDQKSVLIQKLKASKTIKSYPHVGMMVDLDAYFEDPPYPDQLSIGTFIEEATRDFNVIADAILVEEKR